MTISKLHLHVTNRCTSYCKHCSSASGPNGHKVLAKRDFEYILDWAYNQGVRWVEFSGGEPLTLGDDLFAVSKYAHHKPLYISILTNGCLLDKKTAQRLREVGVNSIGISIYGANAKTHNDFTQTPHSFSQTLNGITNISKTGIESIANVIVTPQNLTELHRLPSLLENIDLFTFGSVVPAGRGASLRNYSFSEEGYMHAIKKIESDFIGINHYFMISLYPSSSKDMMRFCMRPNEEVTIDHNGYVIPCCLLPASLRNLRANSHHRDLAKTFKQAYDDPVFHWLSKGHRSMCNYLQYPTISANLCSSCIEMCHLVKSGRKMRNGYSM
ncbi:MAG: radical SAM protein [Candidatus Bathyarchaeota archaeon]|nr:radical SAM protein [Candidatus Bathyarchaeota archaeon]